MAPTLETDAGFAAFLRKYSDAMLGVGVLGLMVTLIMPMPPLLLDLMLALNISSGVLLLVLTMNAKAATELSTFPTILLFSTLFRLGLNVASTRLILTGGQPGSVITAFGSYVAGNNLGVGMVVFLILIIIQFVVITKGSGRISEVAARFVLDAMPGKQMAIDADLNGGLIDADQAKARRAEVSGEAEFYGAMDGASKFVRGDAIAGLIITGLNLLGGIGIATFNGMSIADAARRYSMLTIGDGLVSQIPALFISTAAGVLVTKSSGNETLGLKLFTEVSGRPKATLIAAVMMFTVGLLPGMPKIPFFALSIVLMAVWRSTTSQAREEARVEGDSPDGALAGAAEAAAEADGEDVGELLQVDRVSLEIGYRLIPLVQEKSGGGILEHIAQLRRRFALNEGLILPPVRIKDNIRLGPSVYRLMVGGEEIMSGEVQPAKMLAMDSGQASAPVQGTETVDPAFGLPAWWIEESTQDEAEILGYTVIDPTSVLVTHLAETLRKNLHEILTRDDVKELLENTKKIAPAVVEELVPDKMGLGEIQRVLRNLLRERVPIRNMPAVLEVLADNVGQTRDPDALSELVRQRLGRALCEAHSDKDGTVHAVTLDPAIEGQIASAVGMGTDPEGTPVTPMFLQQLMEKVGASVAQATQGGKDVVLLVRSNVRRFLNELVQASFPKLDVLSYNEVVPARSVETVAIVRMED
ncbi:MAG: flagellar biosynthesis protein FlhA [Chlamydiales bacterium]|jgi:flagellar biosynthesis protein FlhA